jgi:hypothetical protein
VTQDDAPANRETRKWTDYLTRKRVIGANIAIVALLFIFQNTGHWRVPLPNLRRQGS